MPQRHQRCIHVRGSGGREAGIAFVNGLNLFSPRGIWVTPIAGVLPASTTHFRMDEAALAAAGIEEPFASRWGLSRRTSADLKAGLRAAEKVAGERVNEVRFIRQGYVRLYQQQNR